jgi:hypothetical protein
MLDKANDETINTQGVKIRGNYVFVRVNDNTQMLDESTYNSYDTVDTDFVAMAEIISQETPYVEANNRSGWVKRYAFEFDIRDKTKVLAALQEVRDYFFENTVQSITDDSTTYKMNVKVSRPMFVSNRQGAGTIFTSYYIDFFADMVETGYYGNEATHTMCINGGTLQSVILDQAIIGSATAMNPSNDLTSEGNTSNQPTARSVTFQFILNYDGTALSKSILSSVEGIGSRETTYDYRKVFDSVTRNYEFRITGGSAIYKNGVVLTINFNGVEV